MPTLSAPAASVSVWNRAIQPGKGNLDPQIARGLLDLRLSARDRKRATALAEKASEGALTESEQNEMEAIRSVGATLELLQAKARRALRLS